MLAEEGRITSKDVFEALGQGDELAGEVVEKVASYLGLAVANLSSTLNPEKIVIGGGVSKIWRCAIRANSTLFRAIRFLTCCKEHEVSYCNTW